MRFSPSNEMEDGQVWPENVNHHRSDADCNLDANLPGRGINEPYEPGDAIDIFMDEVLKRFNGPVGLAMEVYNEYQHSKSGSLTRKSLLERLMMLMEWRKKAEPPQRLSAIPTAKLIDLAKETLARATQ